MHSRRSLLALAGAGVVSAAFRKDVRQRSRAGSPRRAQREWKSDEPFELR